ncbi:MAG TPA: hypothetical protein VGR35_13690 [Tepidisphaeraceae bacterium]|nr:hypothetical protein [Tepidisphaeraceae bacterium]
MTQINPFIGSILNSTTVQRAQAAEKNSQIQRAQVRSKDSASSGDQFEHQVESSDGLTQIHDQDPQHPQHRKPKHPPKKHTDDPPGDDEDQGLAHIDVKV